MRLINAVFVAMVCVLMSPFVALAQSFQAAPADSIPRLINISAVFQPVDGQPPAPVEAVTLSIYSAPEGGALLWQETQVVPFDKSGRFTVLMGATQVDGIPSEVFASGQAHWMSMQVARAGEVEQPRVRIASVPYALRASDAETLGGLPASAYLLAPTAGDSDPRAASAGSVKAASGTTGEASSGTADLVLAGTTNFLAKYVNSADVGNSAVYETGGNVGIGTTTPLDTLHLRFNNPGGSATGLSVQNLGNTTTSYSGMLFYDQFGALGQFQGFNNVTHEYRINNIALNGTGQPNGSINFMVGSTSRFFIGSTGSIGMGTTAPASNLDVSNALSTTTTAVITGSSFTGTNAAGTLFAGRKARGTSAAPTAVQANDQLVLFAGRGFGTTLFSANSGMTVRAAETFTDTAQGTALQFQTTPIGTITPISQMRLDPFGRLGLGVFSPAAAVEVARDLGGAADILATSYGGESAFNTRTARGTAAAPTALLLEDFLGAYGMTGYGATHFGEFGAGMGAFAAENWTDTAQGTVLGFANTPLASTEAQFRMVIVPDGNVGIGQFDSFPTVLDKLQVFGDIRVGTSGTNGCIKNFGGTGIIGTCASDRRFKRDITPFGPVLGALTALQPVHYFWRAADFPTQHFGDSRAYGLIAQDVEQVLPELVVTGDDGFKAVDYTKLPLLTIEAVKELKDENDALKQRVADLERAFAEVLATAGRH